MSAKPTEARTATAVITALILGLVLGGVGVAGAATGGHFILGKTNTETSVAALSNSKGTPLRLSAPAFTAPLAVNRSTLVQNLNAEYLNGFSSDKLAVQGGDGFLPPASGKSIGLGMQLIVSTGHLSPGVYYVTATALAAVAAGDFGLTCIISKGSDNGANLIAEGGGSYEGARVQAAETAAVSMSAGDTLQEWCGTDGHNGSEIYNAGITAIRVIFFTGTPPA
jgi:hypothetical protein